MIVVFDSSVWVSALHFNGNPARALKLGFFTDKIAICDGIEAEVRRILTEKFGWAPARLANDFDRLLFNASRIAVAGAVRGVCRDPNDDMVLECAINADAGVIVTGDRDLLVLQSYRGVRIVTARQYIDESTKTPHSGETGGMSF